DKAQFGVWLHPPNRCRRPDEQGPWPWVTHNRQLMDCYGLSGINAPLVTSFHKKWGNAGDSTSSTCRDNLSDSLRTQSFSSNPLCHYFEGARNGREPPGETRLRSPTAQNERLSRNIDFGLEGDAPSEPVGALEFLCSMKSIARETRSKAGSAAARD